MNKMLEKYVQRGGKKRILHTNTKQIKTKEQRGERGKTKEMMRRKKNKFQMSAA